MSAGRGERGDVRHERKFLLPARALPLLSRRLPCWPGRFREAYPPRTVNSLYFDTPSRAYLRANLDGLKDRVKTRLRWYGETFGRDLAAALEIKRKDGLAGRKTIAAVSGLRLERHFSRRDIFDAVKRLEIEGGWASYLRGLEPVLLVSYRRGYHASENGRLRATLDSDIRYFSPSFGAGLRLLDEPAAPYAVLELKYPPDAEAAAARVSGKVPARLSRHSKYLRGMRLIRPFS